MTATEQALRGLLRPFGLKVGAVTRRRFGLRVRELVAIDPVLAAIVDPLLAAYERLVAETARLHRLLLQTVRADPVCRMLMTMPGIGPVTALTFRATIDDPHRLDGHARSKPISGSRPGAINLVRSTRQAGLAK